MSTKQIKSKKISELVREEIEHMIKSGEVQPGDKLASVIQLADEFQVSRSAVREALSALRAVGAVTIKQGEGTFVNPYDFSAVFDPSERIISKKEILELLEVRKIMEVGAAELAAEKRTESQLEAMQEALQHMKAASTRADIGETADMAFHLAVVKGAHNHIITDMMTKLSDTLKRTIFESRKVWLFSESQTLEQLYDEHEAIYQAIKNKNRTEARQTMLRHLSSVEAIIRREENREG
ncbi:FadR/GntR family transcriptional regulator [Alteribacillus iranensis]|uniref:Transcriptional regulator, GntR family n=1 Tax=Alteribacillus iranensis TaxID=930128 RepID=A0A1I2DP50_9BACI|nr:FadR/GntR family transcriptional regulator [Alteribacillus iranensis]SFE82111.1 transcriptional regulator, GntR family [Alteribacillus iranensis]